MGAQRPEPDPPREHVLDVLSSRLPVAEPALSFDAFYLGEIDRLVALATGLCGRAQAEDVAQEAMLVTFRRWREVGRRDHPAAFARRVSRAEVATLETLANLRAVGLSIEDMRAYLAGARRGDEAAGEQRALFEAHARRLDDALEALELRRRYLDLKVRYWSAREVGDLDKAADVADELGPLIRRINPKDTA